MLGDPAGATAEEGTALLAALVEGLAAAVRGRRIDTIGRLLV